MYTIIGAGQIAQALTNRLKSHGHSVTILRRGRQPVPGARVISGDAANPADVTRALDGTRAVFHAMHASAYRADVWRRDLPRAERAVMDAAGAKGIPVVFPESVYAYGHHAQRLGDNPPVDPCSPLGEVRAELLAARAQHAAVTISVIASDLVGTTARASASVATQLVIDRLLAGKVPVTLGSRSAPHAFTDLDDLAAAMIHVADNAQDFAGQSLLAPTAPTLSVQQFADAVAHAAEVRPRRVRQVPAAALTAAGLVYGTARSLLQMRYLWTRPVELLPSALSADLGTPEWDSVIEKTVCGARTDMGTRLQSERQAGQSA